MFVEDMIGGLTNTSLGNTNQLFENTSIPDSNALATAQNDPLSMANLSKLTQLAAHQQALAAAAAAVDLKPTTSAGPVAGPPSVAPMASVTSQRPRNSHPKLPNATGARSDGNDSKDSNL